MPDDDYDYKEFEDWQATVELRLGRLKLVGMVDGALGVGALVVAGLAFKGLTNLAKALNEIGQVTAGMHQLVYGQAVAPVVMGPPSTVDKNGAMDETVVPPENEVAKPAMGPESEASERVKGLIAGDPISPAELAKQQTRGVE